MGRLLDLISRKNVQCTLLYGVFNMWLGLLLSAPGPSLLSFSRQTGAPLRDVAWVITARSVLYLCGSFCGVLFQRYDAHRMIAWALVGGVLGTLCIPLAASVPALAASIASQGLVCGIIGTGMNVLIFTLHEGGRVDPYMQALHFLFGVGALIAPPIVGAFIDSAGGSVKGAYVLFGCLGLPIIATLSHFPTPSAASRAFYQSSSEWGSEAVSTAADDSPPPSIEDAPESVTRVDTPSPSPSPPSPDAPAAPADTPPTSFLSLPRADIIVTLTIGTFLCCYVGTELVAGAFTSPFAVKNPALQFSEAHGAQLVSMFWGAFALSRLVTIFVSVHVSALRLLTFSLAGCFLAVGLLLVYGASSISVLWVALGIFGFCMGPCFPAAITLCGAYVEITNHSGVVFTIGAATGEMLFPAIASQLFASDTQNVWRVCAGGLLVGLVCFLIVVCAFRPRHVDANAPAVHTDTLPPIDRITTVAHTQTHPRTLSVLKSVASVPVATKATVIVIAEHVNSWDAELRDESYDELGLVQ